MALFYTKQIFLKSDLRGFMWNLISAFNALQYIVLFETDEENTTL